MDRRHGPAVRPAWHLAETALATLALLYENVRAGRTVDEVARAVRKGLAGVDPEVYLSEYHAYAVGLGFPPEWPEDSIWIIEGSDELLEPGMTFHGVRSLRVPGLMAAGFSETIAVTENGCEILTPHRRELVVVCDRGLAHADESSGLALAELARLAQGVKPPGTAAEAAAKATSA